MRFFRILITLIICVGTGLSIREVLLASIIVWLYVTRANFHGVDSLRIVNNIIIIVGMTTSISYFTLSREHIVYRLAIDAG